jgi:hypothetical protein
MMTTENLLKAEVPEKFKDAQTGAVKMDVLVQSYKELEKRLSQVPAAPKSHTEYCVDCAHGLFVPDEAVNKRLHAKGFTQEQVQEVYDLAAEKLMPMMMEIAAEYAADREVEKLISHFGGADGWREMSRQLLSFGRKNLPTDVLDNLASSYEGVLALHRMMKGEEPKLPRAEAAPKAQDDGDLRSMMRDPRYWKQKDPAFIAKVTEGFQTLYGKG